MWPRASNFGLSSGQSSASAVVLNTLRSAANAVPVYDAGYGPAYGSPAVVVRPYVYGGHSYYGGRGYYGGPYRRY